MRPVSNLNVRQMEVIWTMLNVGTMAEAARLLNVSQPAISRMVRHAEERSGLQLFERRGTRLIPTPDLMVLSKDFERIFMNVDRVQRQANALRQGWGRTVRIGSMPVLALNFLTRAVREMRKIHPGAPLVLKLNYRSGVEQDVINDDLDIGVVIGATQHKLLSSTTIASGEVVCLMPKDHPLAVLRGLHIEHIAQEAIISMGHSSPISRLVDRIFEEHGLERRIAVQAADSRLAAQLVMEGCGIALLDPFFMGSMALDGVIVRSLTPQVMTTCQVVHRRDRALPDLETSLVDILKTVGEHWTQQFADVLAQ